MSSSSCTNTYVAESEVTSCISASSTNQAYIFFHGFPGNVKNEDVAEIFSDQFKADTYLLHYRGLGKLDGSFSFTSAIEEALQLTRRVTEKYKTVHLFGHSFGGLVAIIAANEVGSKLGKLVLASPLTALPDNSTLAEIVKPFLSAPPSLFGVQGLEAILADLDAVRNQYKLSGIAGSLNLKPGQLVVIQASNDAEVPAEQTRQFLEFFSTPPKYRELNQTHAFPDRQSFLKTLLDELKGSNCG